MPYCSTALSSTAALLLCCGGTVGEVQGMGKIHFYFVSHLSYLDSGRYFFVIKSYQMKSLKLLIKVKKIDIFKKICVDVVVDYADTC